MRGVGAETPPAEGRVGLLNSAAAPPRLRAASVPAFPAHAPPVCGPLLAASWDGWSGRFKIQA